jgi:hypothetical protein
VVGHRAGCAAVIDDGDTALGHALEIESDSDGLGVMNVVRNGHRTLRDLLTPSSRQKTFAIEELFRSEPCVR